MLIISNSLIIIYYILNPCMIKLIKNNIFVIYSTISINKLNDI
uniref:Uncharacterized protein n=1 Tax=Osmundaria fimbriata TaxID=228265 RepID=A0A1Z1M4U7_OSMFI|nr:hypothetical protein [Osmundaria fimbriata]ARW60794.1 hypothetical protein [Osmundaria fimbriata]